MCVYIYIFIFNGIYIYMDYILHTVYYNCVQLGVLDTDCWSGYQSLMKMNNCFSTKNYNSKKHK